MSGNQPISIAVADDSRVVRAAIQNLLSHSGKFSVVGLAADGKEAVDLCQKSHPQMVLLDVSMPVMDGLEAARQISQGSPEVIIIMLSSVGDTETVRKALKAGAYDYIIKPVHGPELVAKLLGAFQRDKPKRAAGEGSRDKILVFTGPRSGSGTTSVALNCACTLSRRQGSRVLFVDLDLHYADASHWLGAKRDVSILDLLQADDASRPNVIKRALALSSHGVNLIPAPIVPFVGGLDEAVLGSIIQETAAAFDHVVIDLPPTFDAVWGRVLELADQVLFVVPADVPAVRAARACLELMSKRRAGTRKLKLIFNRNTPEPPVETGDVEEFLSLPVFASIPYDRETVTRSYLSQVPFGTRGEGEIVAQLDGLTDRLFTSREAPPAAAGAAAAPAAAAPPPPSGQGAG